MMIFEGVVTSLRIYTLLCLVIGLVYRGVLRYRREEEGVISCYIPISFKSSLSSPFPPSHLLICESKFGIRPLNADGELM